MTDPADRKALHMEQRARSLRALGVEVRPILLEREVAEDLRMIERVKAEQAHRMRPRMRKRARPVRDVSRPELHADRLARKVGGEFFVREVMEDAPVARTPAERITGVDAERLVKMKARIKLLSERGEGRILAGQTIEQGPWLYPDFARQIAVTLLCFNAGLGSYKELRPADRRRRFFRALEDICNRSDAAVGVGWWVPK